MAVVLKPSTSMINPVNANAAAGAQSSAAVISMRDLKAHCSTCSLRELCLPVGSSPEDVRRSTLCSAPG